MSEGQRTWLWWQGLKDRVSLKRETVHIRVFDDDALCVCGGVLMPWGTLGCQRWCPWELRGSRTSPGLGHVSAESTGDRSQPRSLVHGEGRTHHHFSRKLPHRDFDDGCETIPERSLIANAYLVAGILPCPLRTLLAPWPLGLQQLTHSSVPLGQVNTAKWLHSKETFSKTFPRLLTLCLSSHEADAPRIGCTKLPSDPADAGARPSEDNHVYPRGQPRLPQRLCTPPRSRRVVVSVPSVALRLPALLALLRWLLCSRLLTAQRD